MGERQKVEGERGSEGARVCGVEWSGWGGTYQVFDVDIAWVCLVVEKQANDTPVPTVASEVQSADAMLDTHTRTHTHTHTHTHTG